MSCYVGSVNRTLSVLAALWVLVPTMVVVTGVNPDANEPAALQAVHVPSREDIPAAKAEEPRDPCQPGKVEGLAYSLCIAAYPNRKKARVTNGR